MNPGLALVTGEKIEERRMIKDFRQRGETQDMNSAV
jgi:hypothetical protein